MAIDFAGDLEAIVNAGDLPGATGTLTQDGTESAFTDAVITRKRRVAGGGNKDLEQIDMLLASSGIAVEPHRDARVTFTGETTSWLVIESRPIAPGGTVAGWNMTLIDYTAVTP